MLIVRVIGSDPEKPVTREIVQICAPEDTVESLKDDIAHVTGVDAADQKLYKNSSNGNDVEEVSSHDDEKSLVEAGLVAAEDSSSSSQNHSNNSNKKNDFEFVFLMTPESSYEMLRAVSSSGNDDEAADNHSGSASKKNEQGKQVENKQKLNEADRPTEAKDDDDD